MPNTSTGTSSTAPATIASAPSLPPRVRRILETFFTQVSVDLGERINQMLVEYEQQLFKLAERARSNDKQSEQFANLHALRKSRADLLPMFLAGLEAEVAAIRMPRPVEPADAHQRLDYQTLTLVEDAEMDQDIVLREIARRHDTRSHTPLYLMGQRPSGSGVAGLRTGHLPVGPQTLCKVAARRVAAAFEIDLDSQLLLYRSFDLKVGRIRQVDRSTQHAACGSKAYCPAWVCAAAWPAANAAWTRRRAKESLDDASGR